MPDRPTAPELLEAIRAFLDTNVAPELEGRRRFHLRVAVNLLEILEREWTHGEDALRAEHERLAALLDPGDDASGDLRERVRELNVELAAAIRSGRMDGRWEETLRATYDTTVDTLRIANPKWLIND